MPPVDWTHAKQLFAEALELNGAQRREFLDRLVASDAALGQEVSALVAAHESAEGVGFLANLGGGLGPESAEETFSDPLQNNQAETSKPVVANESEHSTIAYSATNTPGKGTPADDATLSASDLASPADTGRRATDATIAGPTNVPGANAPSMIADDYEVLDELGVGGMGVVYRAYQHSLRRHVALKIIPTRLLRSGEQVARFYLEAESAAGLDHPGIVPVQDVGEHDGVHYYAMALVEGGSLASHVGRGTRLSFRRAAEVIEQVARAVQYAHDHAVIHRDIKPANIMLTKQGQPRLTDFGLAKITGEDEGLTVTGQVMGTPSYMAPEQAEGKSHAISNRTDVYSVGATLYALLSGVPPFRGETVLRTLQQVQNAAPEPLPEDTPIDLRTIVQKCLAKRPEDRYESAAAMADDLRRYLDGFPIAARPVGVWQRALRWQRRNPLLAGLLAAVATTLLVGTVVSTLFGIEARRQADAAAQALAESEANAQRLSQAIEETFIFASEDVLAEEPGMQTARRTLLENAKRYYRGMMDGGQGSPEKLATAAFMLGRVEASLGETTNARASFEQALELQTALVDKADDRAAALLAVARTHNEYARLGKAIWHGQQIDVPTAEARSGLVLWLEQAGKCAEFRTRAVNEQPANAERKRLQANGLMNLALAKIEAAIAQPNNASTDEIRELIEESQAIRSALLAPSQSEEGILPRVDRDYALGLAATADLETLQGDRAADTEQATSYWRRSLALRREAAQRLAAIPDSARTQDISWKLAITHQLCAEQSYQLGEPSDAIASFEAMREVMHRLLTQNPGVGRFRTGLAKALFNLSQLHYATNRIDAGGTFFADCQDVLVEGVVAQPGGDSLSQLVDYTLTLAQSLAEHPSLRSQAIGMVERAESNLAELSLSQQDKQLIAASRKRLRDAAEQMRSTSSTADSA